MNDDVSNREESLRQDVEDSERVLTSLEKDLGKANDKLADLLHQGDRYSLLGDICRSLDKLEELDAGHLFWSDVDDRDSRLDTISAARERIDEHQREIAGVEAEREALIDRIGDQNRSLDCLHYELIDVMEREEFRRNEWVVEREAEELPAHEQVMPWARRTEEDRRFRQSLLSSLATSVVVVILLGSVAIPIKEREEITEVPERVARLVQQRIKPPEPEPQPVFEEELPEPEPEEPVETLVDELVPEAVETPAVVEEPDVREQVKAKGILAFSSSISDRANMNTRAQLGSSATLRNAGVDAVGRTQRSMVTTNAPGSSGGINLSDISRDYGGGGGGSLDGVQVSQVASSIGTGGSGNADRPLAGGAVAGRTDEEIQIVFDRHKAALYRLYNRELRKNPTLRGQIVLKLTIEPDGTVSYCIQQSSTMDAPVLSAQVVERVITFDFGAKEDIAAVTIIYPIDFLPAA